MSKGTFSLDLDTKMQFEVDKMGRMRLNGLAVDFLVVFSHSMIHFNMMGCRYKP